MKNKDNKDKMIGDKKMYMKIMVNYLLFVAIVLTVFFVVPKFLAVMWPFVVGWIIAMIANPLVHFLEKKVRIVRKHGSAIVIVTVLVLVISLLYFLVYAFIKQSTGFISSIPEMYETASEELQKAIDGWRINVSFLSGNTVDGIVDKIGGFIDKFADDVMSSNLTVSNAGMVVKSVAEGLLMTVITILLCFFLTAEHDNLIKVYKDKMPAKVKKTYKLVMDNIIYALVGYLKAQFKIMVCVFIILAIGFLVLGVEYALLIAFIVSFIDFLPVFGAGAVIWPWCVYDLIMGNYVEAIVIFALYIVCQGVRQFLQPKMVADSIGLSPLATLFFMFIGYRVSGIIGMIIGIPIGMIIMSFYKIGMFDRLIKGTKIIIHDLNEWRKF